MTGPALFAYVNKRSSALDASVAAVITRTDVWGAVRKNIISDRFSTKTAISAHI